MGPVVNVEELIKEYKNGASMNYLADTFGTYPTTVKRILEESGIELRHDNRKKGELCVEGGEKLIKWAKAQGRLVTKAELAKVAGTKKLSPSYFIKYPELGKYVVTREQNEIQEYTQKLYEWLKENDIPYKPNDKKEYGVSVSALLLNDYKGIAIQTDIKPKCVSKKKHEEMMQQKLKKVNGKGHVIIFLKKEHFDDLQSVNSWLNALKD
jgi:hypothetical protein